MAEGQIGVYIAAKFLQPTHSGVVRDGSSGSWEQLNTLCLTGISLMFSIKSKICQTSGGQEKFASNLIFDFLMKTELF